MKSLYSVRSTDPRRRARMAATSSALRRRNAGISSLLSPGMDFTVYEEVECERQRPIRDILATPKGPKACVGSSLNGSSRPQTLVNRGPACRRIEKKTSTAAILEATVGADGSLTAAHGANGKSAHGTRYAPVPFNILRVFEEFVVLGR